MSDNYTGVRVIEVKQELIAQLYQAHYIPTSFDKRYNFSQNEYVILKDQTDGPTKCESVITRCIKDRLIQVKDRYKLKASNVEPRNKEQHMALDALLDDRIKVVIITGRTGAGKAQPLDAKILTPTGWTTMGEIKEGDIILTPAGEKSKVLSIHPQGVKDIYRVIFQDGSSTKCCMDHLWHTKTYKDRIYKRQGTIKTLSEIEQSLKYGKHERRNHNIPMVEAISFDQQELPIDGYTLGCILGDGSITNQTGISSQDDNIITNLKQSLKTIGCNLSYLNKYDYIITSIDKTNKTSPAQQIRSTDVDTKDIKIYKSVRHATKYGYSYYPIYRAIKSCKIYKGCYWEYVENSKPLSTNPLKHILLKLGIYGLKSEQKFIPKEYLYSSYNTRLQLLQGLMDTDGTIQNKYIYLSTSSPYLRDDFRELAQSLGMKVNISVRLKPKYTYNGKKKIGKPNYRISISPPSNIEPFRLKRKLIKYKPRSKYPPTRYIDKIEYVGKEQAQCIYIDNPEHLYITDDYIVTHNTLLTLAAALQKMDDRIYDKMILTRPMSWVGRHGLGTLPGDVSEKLQPYLQNYMCNIEHLLSGQRNTIEHLIHHYRMEFVPIQLIRGASWANSFIIADECQVLNADEMVTLGTRVGEGSKIVIMGDLNQRDENIAKDKTGIYRFVNHQRTKDSLLVTSIELIKCVRSDVSRLFADVFER